MKFMITLNTIAILLFIVFWPSREEHSKELEAQYSIACGESKTKDSFLTCITKADVDRRIGSGFTNGVFTLMNVRKYEHRSFRSHKLLDVNPMMQVEVGTTLIIPKDDFIVFEFGGREYTLNYWCNSSKCMLAINPMNPKCHRLKIWNGNLGNNLWVKHIGCVSGGKSYYHDEENCSFKFIVKNENFDNEEKQEDK